MPSIGLHLAVTLFFLAAVLKDAEYKPALLLLPFGLISDLDSFVGVHRATLHNLFILLVPLLVLVASKRLKVSSTIKDRYFIFASLLLAAHIFLDAFYNGVFLFYPFIEKSYNPLFWFGLKETGLSVLFTWIVPGNVGELVYATPFSARNTDHRQWNRTRHFDIRSAHVLFEIPSETIQGLTRVSESGKIQSETEKHLYRFNTTQFLRENE